MKWWNNGTINKRSYNSPGIDFISGRKPFKRMSPSIETIQKQSESHKGQIAWNKGLKTGPESEETKYKKKLSAIKRVADGIYTQGFYKGQVNWNYGLTANTDSRILAYKLKQIGQKRVGNYPKGKDHIFYNPNLSEFKHFKYQVHQLSEVTYKNYKDVINPNNHTRGKCGNDGVYQLDHITSIKQGYDTGKTIKELSSIDNLQMLSWEDNLRKSNK